ncbi:MAG: hypothetical protein AAF141_03170 [Pseudomonadota bacterium]
MTEHQNRFDRPGDEPLDPAVERVRQKMQRVQLVSLSIMLLGVAAVIAAIGYKIWIEPQSQNTNGASTSQQAAQAPATIMAPTALVEQASITLPKGARIVESSLNGRQLLMRLRIGSNSAFWIIDTGTGEVVSKIALVNGE